MKTKTPYIHTDVRTDATEHITTPLHRWYYETKHKQKVEI